MNRFEALDKLAKVQKLMDDQRYGQAMQEVGMNDDLFPDGQSLDELFGAFMVRVADLCKIAGLNPPENKK